MDLVVADHPCQRLRCRGSIRMVRSHLIACGPSLKEERGSCDPYASHHRSRGDGNRTFDDACGKSGHEPLQPVPYLVVGNGADDDQNDARQAVDGGVASDDSNPGKAADVGVEEPLDGDEVREGIR
jgi:hypothetical protein